MSYKEYRGLREKTIKTIKTSGYDLDSTCRDGVQPNGLHGLHGLKSINFIKSPDVIHHKCVLCDMTPCIFQEIIHLYRKKMNKE